MHSLQLARRRTLWAGDCERPRCRAVHSAAHGIGGARRRAEGAQASALRCNSTGRCSHGRERQAGAVLAVGVQGCRSAPPRGCAEACASAVARSSWHRRAWLALASPASAAASDAAKSRAMLACHPTWHGAARRSALRPPTSPRPGRGGALVSQRCWSHPPQHQPPARCSSGDAPSPGIQRSKAVSYRRSMAAPRCTSLAARRAPGQPMSVRRFRRAEVSLQPVLLLLARRAALNCRCSLASRVHGSRCEASGAPHSARSLMAVDSWNPCAVQGTRGVGVRPSQHLRVYLRRGRHRGPSMLHAMLC